MNTKTQVIGDGNFQMPRFPSKIIVVNASERFCENSHGFNRRWGVSARLSGTKALSMAEGELPPRTVANAHSHSFETGILITSGQARVFFGDDLRAFIDVKHGDFLTIPENLVHCPVNFADEVMRYVVARATGVED